MIKARFQLTSDSSTAGMAFCISMMTLLGPVSLLSQAMAVAEGATEAGVSAPWIPRLEGPWMRLVARPPLEKWASERAEPVDFTVFRADDGRWQLISCIRHTTHPGGTRLLYRWSSAQLMQEGWQPEGIFLSSKPE